MAVMTQKKKGKPPQTADNMRDCEIPADQEVRVVLRIEDALLTAVRQFGRETRRTGNGALLYLIEMAMRNEGRWPPTPGQSPAE